MKLTLPKRTEPQKRIQESPARFKVASWGRQSGKTTNGGWTMVKKPLLGPRFGRYWHILQTHTAASIAFDRYVRLFPKSSWSTLWAKKPNESEKTVFLTGFREVSFKSGQNFEDLRSETLHGAIIDECRQQDPRLWKMIIRPMLGRYGGWCEFYSTPNGFDWFYDLTQDHKDDPEWEFFHAPSWEAWWWTPEEIASAKRTMSEAEFAQEIGAEFRDLTRGKAYVNFGPHNLRRGNPWTTGDEWNEYLPIGVGMDFNLSPMAWSLSQRKANKMHFGGEIWIPNSNGTAEAAQVLADRVQGHKPGVILCGDATAKAGQRAAAAQSDYDILCQVLDANGIPWTNLTPESNPRVKDRVNTVNARLMSASGDVDVTVDPEKCPMLVKDFERVVWKEGNAGVILDQKTDPMLTHMSDGAGYIICQNLPLDAASSKPGLLSVIIR